MDVNVELCDAYESDNNDCDGYDNESNSDDNMMSEEQEYSENSEEGLSEVSESGDGNSISSDK